MKKIFYKLVNPIRTAYWTIFRPKTIGVKCLIECKGKFLMIRHTYGFKYWTFPGGGLKSGETPEEAAKREIHEEVGIELTNLVHVGEYFSNNEQDTGHCFFCKVQDTHFKIDGNEVFEADWFAPTEIPALRGSAVNKLLKLYQSFALALAAGYGPSGS
jgi:8-oxo-dGTP pyrophosphatase MutT (NUDIX family)